MPGPTPNSFKRALKEGRPQLGLWLGLESPTATEIVAGSGFDWLLLDMEHTSLDAGEVVQHLRAAHGGTAEVMVRVPFNEPIVVKRLLDLGARSLMFPMVNNAEDARRAVAATRYPPDGIRGFAGTTRAAEYGRNPAYAKTCAEELCVVVQIESAAGVQAIEEIAAVDGVDGLFVGPNDLAASLGFLGQPRAPEVVRTVEEAVGRIRSTGKAAGVLNFVPDQARGLLEAGYQFIAVGSDAGILARRSEGLLDEFRPRN